MLFEPLGPSLFLGLNIYVDLTQYDAADHVAGCNALGLGHVNQNVVGVLRKEDAALPTKTKGTVILSHYCIFLLLAFKMTPADAR